MTVQKNGREIFNESDINNPDIDGGTADSLTIGGSTPAPGTFTTVTVNTSQVMGDAVTQVWDIAPASNNGFSGQQESVTAGATVALGDALYENADGEWYLADADSTATMPALRMAVGAGTDGNAVNTITKGVVRLDTWTWTPGLPIYVSTTGTTTNTLTQTAPSGDLDCIQIVGYALTATVMYFDPSPIVTEVGLDVEDDDAGSTITMAELSAIPKTFLCTTGSAGDKTFTFDAPSASDVGKEFILIKEDAGGTGKIVLDAPDGVTISRAADTSSAGGTYTSEASKFQMIHVKIISATQLYVMKTDGTWTAA